MDMFALNEDVTKLENDLDLNTGITRLVVLVPLAWHLRQRNPRQAIILVDEADRLLAENALPEASFERLSARLLLIRAEIKWLFGGLASAAGLAELALEKLSTIDDQIACADAHWLLAAIARDQGDSDRNEAELELSAAATHLTTDQLRIDIVEAELARWMLLRDVTSAHERWSGRFNNDNHIDLPSVTASVSDYLGLLAHQSSDFALSVTHWIRTHDAALATGQLRRAITAATNIGDDFSSVGDHQAALEWMEKALDLARLTGWPVSIGVCLDATAATMRHLGKLDIAQQLQRSALATLAPFAGSRNYAIALRNFGDLALDRGDNEVALDTFHQLQERADAIHQTDFQTMARRGLAHALCNLGRLQEAQIAALDALSIAQSLGDAYRQIEALKVLAKIYSNNTLPTPPGITAASTQLHYLLLAQEIYSGKGGETMSSDLLDLIANAYASMKNFEAAFHALRNANEVRKKVQGLESANRTTVLKVLYEAERVRIEEEHRSRLAASEELRAEALEKLSETEKKLVELAHK